MADLFDTIPPPSDAPGPAHRPLADRILPRRLSDVIGQAHVLGPEGPLGAMLAAGSLSSLILWGPPGVGKTTIATMAGEPLTVTRDGNNLRIAGPGGQSALITGTEQPARNGVVHEIDTVLAAKS